MTDQMKLERLMGNLRKDESFSKRNRQFILTFVNRCMAEGIRAKRHIKYIYTLKQIAMMMGKDFDMANKDDIQKLVAQINNSSLKEWTKHDYKVAIKKFYRIMEGKDDDPEFCPEKVRWLKTTMKEEDFVNPNELLRPHEVDRIISRCTLPLHKTVCRFLFETGVRAGELLSLKISDVNLEEGYVTVNGTKTRYSKRIVPISESIPLLSQWLDVHPNCNPDNSLWITNLGTRLSYGSLCYILSEGAKRAGIINKKVNPHAWRKASATENSKYLKYPELCAYHGWKIGSDIPMLYIRYTQEDIKKAFQRKNGIVEEAVVKKNRIKKCGGCGKICEPTVSFCPSCGFMFSDCDKVSTLSELCKRRKQADTILDIVTKHPKLLETLEEILKKEISN